MRGRSPGTGAEPMRPARLVVVVVVTELVIALVTATSVYVAWQHLDGNLTSGAEISHAHKKPAVSDDASNEPLNILVLGTDTRAGAGDAIDGEKGCNCSDTTILVHVAADRQRPIPQPRGDVLEHTFTLTPTELHATENR